MTVEIIKAYWRLYVVRAKLYRIRFHIWYMDRLYWLIYGEKLWLEDKK